MSYYVEMDRIGRESFGNLFANPEFGQQVRACKDFKEARQKCMLALSNAIIAAAENSPSLRQKHDVTMLTPALIKDIASTFVSKNLKAIEDRLEEMGFDTTPSPSPSWCSLQ